MRILTVRRSRACLAVLLALALPVLLVLPAPAATKAHVINCSLPVGGTVASIDAESRTFEMTVTSNGVGVATVWVQRASVIVIREVDQQTQVVVAERPARFEDLRAGHRVAIQAMCLDDGRLVVINGAILQITNSGVSTSSSTSGSTSASSSAPGAAGSRPVSQPASTPVASSQIATLSVGAPVTITGTVIAKTGSTITVGGKALSTVTVDVDGSTKVSGQRTSLGTVMLNDTVRIEAVKTSNGRLRARGINVMAVQVRTILGTITAKGNGYLVINGAQKVLVSGDTLVLVNGAVKSVADLVVGTKVAITAAVEPVTAAASGTVSGAAQVGASTQAATDTVKAVVIKVVKTLDP